MGNDAFTPSQHAALCLCCCTCWSEMVTIAILQHQHVTCYHGWKLSSPEGVFTLVEGCYLYKVSSVTDALSGSLARSLGTCAVPRFRDTVIPTCTHQLHGEASAVPPQHPVAVCSGTLQREAEVSSALCSCMGAWLGSADRAAFRCPRMSTGTSCGRAA